MTSCRHNRFRVSVQFLTRILCNSALNHILLLKPEQYSQRQLNVIGKSLLDEVYNSFLDEHCSFNNTVDKKFMDTLENQMKVMKLSDPYTFDA